MVLLACAAPDSPAVTEPAADSAPSASAADSADTAVAAEPRDLQLTFLAVGGFHLRVGHDALLTAPLYTNPNLWDTLTDPVASDPAVIDRFLPDVSDARAILVGHAHYDHLLDVPYVRTLTDDATVYGNESVKTILSTFGPGCGHSLVPEDRVVDVTGSIDGSTCPDVDTCSALGGGEWLPVVGTNARIRALCSSHPDQFWVIHFGAGCMEPGTCAAPEQAGDWLEGTTVAWLIDFLDANGTPEWRVYYQDAPTDAPVGHPGAELLAEKAVDLALLNAGNYDAVADHPGEIIRAMQPKYVVMGHWEDFFQTLDEPVEVLPFLDMDDLRARLEAELPGMEGVRWWVPMPGEEWGLAH